jgi:REP element-mobilizing transposase RayT
MTAIDRKKITWYMNKLYRNISFTKDDIDRVKKYYNDRGDDREYFVHTFRYSAVDNIKQLIRILSKFY